MGVPLLASYEIHSSPVSESAVFRILSLRKSTVGHHLLALFDVPKSLAHLALLLVFMGVPLKRNTVKFSGWSAFVKHCGLRAGREEDWRNTDWGFFSGKIFGGTQRWVDIYRGFDRLRSHVLDSWF